MVEDNIDYKDNYIKSIKNWITVVSYISFVMNLITIDEITPLISIAFMYFSSAGLAFYALKPIADKSKKRRDFIVKSSIAAIFILIIALIINSNFPVIETFVLYCIKGIYAGGSIIIPYFSFKDDTENETQAEKDMRKKIKKDIADGKNREKFKFRDNSINNNKETKKFVINKKPKREDN